MDKAFWIYAIGFSAQILFSARMLIQWIASEKAKKVISPNIYWQLSLVGSFLLFTYGWVIDDFAIILGQFISYYIYIWNINMNKKWHTLPLFLRIILTSIPVIILTYFLTDLEHQVDRLFKSDVPLWLVVYGSIGQVIFTLRFVYQMWYSKKMGASLLPQFFWVISLTGSILIISYAVFRLDPVLIMGQFPGAIVYTRNIVLSKRK